MKRVDVFRCTAFNITEEGGPLCLTLGADSAHASALAFRATLALFQHFARVLCEAQRVPLTPFEAFKITLTNQQTDLVIRNGTFAIIVDKALATLLSDALLTF